MSANLLRLYPSSNPSDRVTIQDTTFTTDAVGRYICSTWEEATQNGGVELDAVVIGAGMFGGYCAEKLYRDANLRVLVLDAGSLLVTEHVQNLSRIGLKDAGGVTVPSNASDPGIREVVWGNPWRSQQAFPGLAYCLGGRSLYWGGWSPRLTKDDLDQWPQEIHDYLQNPGGLTCSESPTDPAVDEYCRTEREIGVVPTTDFISGTLFGALKQKAQAAVGQVATIDAIEDAPLAVQASPPAFGLFSFDKWSSAPILVDALRDDAMRAIMIDSVNPDWQRRLFYVPRAHVAKLHCNGGTVAAIEVWLNGQQKFLNIAPKCAVILANGTIEATRLALESFPTSRTGRNLMAHLRSNTTVRIHRSALGITLGSRLEAAALLVRGSTADGRYHLQVTAAATPKGPDSAMFSTIPDIDLLGQMMAAQKDDWVVVTLRGIGEMTGDQDPNKTKVTGSAPSWVDLSDQTEGLPAFANSPQAQFRRAWVNLATTQSHINLWNAMDTAAMALAKKLANNDMTKFEVVTQTYHDPLGSTHHEAGTLWMGTDPTKSVTNLNGRFHHISNAYVAGPALFPTLGSANPSLTALSLARRTARSVVLASLGAEAADGFVPLGTGGVSGWQMVGPGGFMELGGNLIESVGGMGLLWYTREQFEDFVLRADFRLSSPTDNSGIFIRFPNPSGNINVPIDQGYEIQIDNTGYNNDTNTYNDPQRRTGAIYKLAPSSGPMPSVGQWHTFEVEAIGSTITVRLDGAQVSQLTNAARSPSGYIGLQNHHDGSKVQFTRLRIKKLVTAAAAAPAARGRMAGAVKPKPSEVTIVSA